MEKSNQLKVVSRTASQSEQLTWHQWFPPGVRILTHLTEIKIALCIQNDFYNLCFHLSSLLFFSFCFLSIVHILAALTPPFLTDQVLQGGRGVSWDASVPYAWTASPSTWKRGPRSLLGSNPVVRVTVPVLGCTAGMEGSAWRSITATCVTAATPPMTALSALEVRRILMKTCSLSNWTGRSWDYKCHQKYVTLLFIFYNSIARQIYLPVWAFKYF